MKPSTKIIGSIFLVFIGLAILGNLLPGPSNRTPSNAPPSVASPPPAAFIKITVTRSEYAHGYLRLVGTAENTGRAAAFSPSIQVNVFATGGKTLLAKDVAYPAGAMLKNFEPGASAAFETITRIPGEPEKITFDVGLVNLPGKVEFKR